MNCRDCQPLLSGLLDDELDPTTAAEVREHLDACPVCRREFEQLLESMRLVRALEPVTAPVALGDRLRKRLLAEVRPPWYRQQSWMLAVAACLALALVSWPFWLQPPPMWELRAAEPQDDSVGVLGDLDLAAVPPETAAGGYRVEVRASLEVPDVDLAMTSIVAQMLDHGGRAEEAVRAHDGFGGSYLVPERQFHDFMAQLELLGSLTWERVAGVDVDSELVAASELVAILEGMLESGGPGDDLTGEDLARLAEKLAEARMRADRAATARAEVRIELTLRSD